MDTQIGPLHTRRSILINASPERVWREFETLAQVRAWLGIGQTIHQFDLELGGSIDLSVEIEGAQHHFGGSILVLESEKELSVEIQWQSPNDWPVPTFWTFSLSPLYGGTHVELFHHGFERLGSEAGDNLQGYEEGWSVRHLSALRTIVETT